ATAITVNPGGTSLTGTTPAGAPGAATVQVTTAGGISNSLPYTYVGVPAATTLSPTSGTSSGGTAFTLTGSNLQGAAVTFNAVPATAITVNPGGTSLTGTTPAGAPGAATVQVTTGGGSATVPGGFTYILRRAYVTNAFSNTVSVISTVSNTVLTSINVGTNPSGMAVTPSSTRAYV
ncbi:YncE family protein, partial [Streptomyces sp. NPDC058394]|uniref:YncE family protein n=1 Tax=Streptomyces sp. NPDC058394 TaxID=3346477 RepID=UPI00365C0D0A